MWLTMGAVSLRRPTHGPQIADIIGRSGVLLVVLVVVAAVVVGIGGWGYFCVPLFIQWGL